MFKNLFLRGAKIQRKIDFEVSKAKHSQRILDEKEKKKELIDQAMKYEKLLTMRNQKIKRLENQIESDRKAWDTYKEDVCELERIFKELTPSFLGLQNKFAQGISLFNQKKDEVERLARLTQKKENKVEKLLTEKVG